MDDKMVRKKMPLFIKCLILVLAIGIVHSEDNTSSTTTTTTTETPTTTGEEGTTEKTYANALERFFASDYNKATYLVLPAMILVYGGCSCIYCVSKLRRYLRRRERQQRKDLLEQRNHGFDDTEDDKAELTSGKDVDHTLMFTAPKQPVSSYANLNKEKNWVPEKAVAMEVEEIDKQLKQAFAMISNVTYDIREKRLRQMKSKPDLLPSEQENELTIKKKRKFKQRAYLS